MDKARQILKKYKSRLTIMSLAIFFIYIALAYILAWVIPVLVLLLYAVIYIVATRILTNILWRKYISGVLLDDVDAPLYRDVILAGRIGERNPMLAMESEFFVGNVTAALEIGNAVLKNEKFAKNNAHVILALLAEYNFFIGDDEALVSACKRFRELKMSGFKSKRIKRMTQSIEKFERYLAGDFDGFLRPTGKKRKEVLYSLIRSYYEGRVALRKGERESARTIFSGLAVAADNTIFATLSKCAVDSIDRGIEFREAVSELPCETIDTDALIKNYEDNLKKSKKRTVIVWIIVAAALLSLLPDSISDWQWSREERITVRLIDDQYSDIELLGLIYIDDDEVMFLAEADEGLLLGGRHLDENEEWQVQIYGYYPIDELVRDGRYRGSFIKYDNSVQMYFCFSDDFSMMDYDDAIFKSHYSVDDLGFVVLIIDDKVIE